MNALRNRDRRVWRNAVVNSSSNPDAPVKMVELTYEFDDRVAAAVAPQSLDAIGESVYGPYWYR
jgi:hypothetical protein